MKMNVRCVLQRRIFFYLILEDASITNIKSVRNDCMVNAILFVAAGNNHSLSFVVQYYHSVDPNGK